MPNESNRSVLVVEADPSLNVAASELLQSAGFEVRSASTFQEGKHLLATTSPDVLVTGLRLGAYNGLHLVLRSRADNPATYAIVMSDVRDRVLQQEAFRQSAAFLVRPLDDDRLLNAVSRSLGHDAQSSTTRRRPTVEPMHSTRRTRTKRERASRN